jgi:hypothetical protein
MRTRPDFDFGHLGYINILISTDYPCVASVESLLRVAVAQHLKGYQGSFL